MDRKRKYVIVNVLHNAPRKVRNKLSKLLLGTTVSINGRRYRSKGLLRKFNGIMLCPGTYLLPIDNLEEFLKELENRGLRDLVVVRETCMCNCIV